MLFEGFNRTVEPSLKTVAQSTYRGPPDCQNLVTVGEAMEREVRRKKSVLTQQYTEAWTSDFIQSLY